MKAAKLLYSTDTNGVEAGKFRQVMERAALGQKVMMMYC